MKKTLMISLALIALTGHAEVREVKCQKVGISKISEQDEPVAWVGGRDFWVYNKKITKGAFDYEVEQDPLRAALKVSQVEYRLKFAFVTGSVGFCWNDEIGSSTGLWRTTDGGITWTPMIDGEVRRCIANVSNGGLYFYNRLSSSSEPRILWVDRKGELASSLEFPKGLGFGYLMSAVDGKLFTGVFYAKNAHHLSSSLVVATTPNGGKEWKTIRVTPPGEQGRILTVGAPARMEFLEGNTGGMNGHQLYLAKSGGGHWRRLAGINWVGVYFTSETHVYGLRTPKEKNYGFAELELWESNDSGAHWSKLQVEGAPDSLFEDLHRRLDEWQDGQQWVLRHLAKIP